VFDGNVVLHIQRLRARARMCRGVAAMPTNGGHATDRMLRDIADRLEREADELEANGE
jgi:hypothetical protein